MNYRCYHFNNFYCQQLMAGIQTAHAQHELAIKYLATTPIRDDEAESLLQFSQRERNFYNAKNNYLEWAQNHKTIIVLNGGMQCDLQEWVKLLSDSAISFAWAEFREDQDALNGALTNVALVLPDRIYVWAREVTRAADQLPHDAEGSIHICTEAGAGLFRRCGNGAGEIQLAGGEIIKFSTQEIQLMAKLSQCRLM